MGLIENKFKFKKVNVGGRFKEFVIESSEGVDIYKARVSGDGGVWFVRMVYDFDLENVVELFVYDEVNKRVVVELLGEEADRFVEDYAGEFDAREKGWIALDTFFKNICLNLDMLIELANGHSA